MLPNSKATGSNSHLEKSRRSEPKCVLLMRGLLPWQKRYHYLASLPPSPGPLLEVPSVRAASAAWLTNAHVHSEIKYFQSNFCLTCLKITSLSNLILTRAHDIVTSRSHWREGRKISWNKNITPWQIHWQECIAFHFLVLYKNILDVLTTDE